MLRSVFSAGNIRLRTLIDDLLEDYQRSSTKMERSLIVSRIVEGAIGGNGGGFVRQDSKTKRWFQVGSRTAREKVGQAIRAALKKHEKYDAQHIASQKHAKGYTTGSFSTANQFGEHREVTLPTSPHNLQPRVQPDSPIHSSSFGPSVASSRQPGQQSHRTLNDQILQQASSVAGFNLEASSMGQKQHHRPQWPPISTRGVDSSLYDPNLLALPPIESGRLHQHDRMSPSFATYPQDGLLSSPIGRTSSQKAGFHTQQVQWSPTLGSIHSPYLGRNDMPSQAERLPRQTSSSIFSGQHESTARVPTRTSILSETGFPSMQVLRMELMNRQLYQSHLERQAFLVRESASHAAQSPFSRRGLPNPPAGGPFTPAQLPLLHRRNRDDRFRYPRSQEDTLG